MPRKYAFLYKKYSRPITTIAVIMAAGIALAACSSSTSSKTPSVASSSQPSKANTALAAATAVVKKYEQVPTTIPINTPLKYKPPTGKTIAFMECNIDQCTVEADALRTITAALGWTLKTFPYNTANPATLVAGMQEALQYKPVATLLSGVPEAEWASVVPAYQKAGVSIVVAYVGPQTLNNTIIANIGGPSSVARDAKIIADYFIAKSDGQGRILQFQVPDFPILAVFDQDFRSDVSSECKACSITTLTGTIAEVTGPGATSAILAALQRHPSIGWVVTDDGPWLDGFPAAAANAGIHVKIIGEGADTVDETDIKAGTMTAFTSLALNYGEWAAVDAVLRHMEGMTIPANEGDLPVQLLTQHDSWTVSPSYNEPADYATMMEKLWHLTS